MTFELKSVAGKSILFVMAAEAEYGPFLRSRFEPLMTGVGPVEAAVVLTRTLSALEHQGELPQLVYRSVLQARPSSSRRRSIR
jgi:adenosylhomocysteine nucleosidase